MRLSRRQLLAATATTLLPLAGCGGGGGGGGSVTPTRGRVRSATKTRTLSIPEMTSAGNLLGITGMQSRPPAFPVDLYAVQYDTPDLHGAISVASGLVAFPVGFSGSLIPTAYFHGTVTARTEVPSNASDVEGLLAAALLASGGLLLVAPDYLGLGSSPVPHHAYEHAGSLATAGVDLLRAARHLAQSQGRPVVSKAVYLAGYSEGGYTTMAVHRALEAQYADEFSVALSVPCAGPYSLSDVSLRFALGELGPTSSSVPAYVAGLILGYNDVYGLFSSLTEPFTPSVAAQIPALFDGTHSLDAIAAALPGSVTDMLNPAFVDALRNNPDHPFRRALKQNDVDDWRNQGRILFYHGDQDHDVPFQNTQTAFQKMSALGGPVTLGTLPPGLDHQTALPVILNQIYTDNAFPNQLA